MQCNLQELGKEIRKEESRGKMIFDFEQLMIFALILADGIMQSATPLQSNKFFALGCTYLTLRCEYPT